MMTLPVFFTPEAKQDVRAARDWYLRENEQLANKFIHDLFSRTDRIAGNPEQFAIIYRDVRQCVLQHFPYVISFRVRPKQIEILSVLHGHRDPREWQDRS